MSLFGAQVGGTERGREIHKGGRWEGPMAMQCVSHAEHPNQQVEASTIGISCLEQKRHFKENSKGIGETAQGKGSTLAWQAEFGP